MRIDAERQKQRAAALAALLAPIIEARLAAEPLPAPVMAKLDRDLIEAARKVAEAVTRVEQSKYGPDERPAREALLRRAAALRARLTAREHSGDRP